MKESPKQLPEDVDPASPGVAQCVRFSNGSLRWYTDGILGRSDGPAAIHPSGRVGWYRDGKRHREDGPAVITPSGVRAWYRDGWLHREDGPAFETADGDDT